MAELRRPGSRDAVAKHRQCSAGIGLVASGEFLAAVRTAGGRKRLK